mgnify:CR=1 FL=1
MIFLHTIFSLFVILSSTLSNKYGLLNFIELNIGKSLDASISSYLSGLSDFALYFKQ